MQRFLPWATEQYLTVVSSLRVLLFQAGKLQPWRETSDTFVLSPDALALSSHLIGACPSLPFNLISAASARSFLLQSPNSCQGLSCTSKIPSANRFQENLLHKNRIARSRSPDLVTRHPGNSANISRSGSWISQSTELALSTTRHSRRSISVSTSIRATAVDCPSAHQTIERNSYTRSPECLAFASRHPSVAAGE